jgi:CheY-like chemotaxis protein
MTDNILKDLVDILIVEDNELDVEAVERAFKKSDVKNPLHKACDGIEALKILRAKKGQTLPIPCVILLDINMPRMDGLQLLKQIRQDTALHQIIVFILTTSGHARDRAAAYEQNVAGYFLKENLAILVEALKPYCRGNEFPDNRPSFS